MKRQRDILPDIPITFELMQELFAKFSAAGFADDEAIDGVRVACDAARAGIDPHRSVDGIISIVNSLKEGHQL